MPADQITVNAFVCEKILQEPDGVMSAIRIADVFYYTPAPPSFNIPLKNQAIHMFVYAAGRFPIGDSSEHTIELYLVRPDGDARSVGPAEKAVFSSKIPSAPPGFNVNVHMGVIPEQMGIHYFSIRLDGNEVGRAPFTLVRREAEVLQ